MVGIGGIPLVSRFFNSRYLLQKPFRDKMIFVGCLQTLGWLIIIYTQLTDRTEEAKISSVICACLI